MESLVVRPAQPSDAADLARNWIDAAQHYAELDVDAFRFLALTAWSRGSRSCCNDLDQRMPSGWSPRSTAAWWEMSLPAWSVRPRMLHGQLLRDLGRVRLFVDARGVEQGYRRRGIGARLMHAVEEWGRDKGAVRSVLTTYHASPLSVPFYQQGMGYERRSIIFEKRLD